MDRGLLTRALIVGFVCFVLAAGGYYYQTLTAEQSRRVDTPGPVAGNNDGTPADGPFHLFVIGFFVIVIIAGALTILISAQYRTDDLFWAAAIAGGMPVLLFWIVLWCLDLTDIIDSYLRQEPFGFDDLTIIGLMAVINVLMVVSGALIAGLTGLVTRSVSARVTG